MKCDEVVAWPGDGRMFAGTATRDVELTGTQAHLSSGSRSNDIRSNVDLERVCGNHRPLGPKPASMCQGVMSNPSCVQGFKMSDVRQT